MRSRACSQFVRTHWPLALPLLALGVLAGALLSPSPGWTWASAAALIGAVVAAVHHAEVVAHRVGEPFGTLVLALAVTAIEASLVISVIVSAGAEAEALARDTIYATVMIIGSGVIGLCVLVGAIRHHEQTFRIEGAGPAFAALATLAVLVLVMPVFTVTVPGARYSHSQHAFVAVSSLVLWCVFVFFQTVRHRDYFLPTAPQGDESVHAPPPSVASALQSFGLLLVSLVAIVGLAKTLSPTIEAAVRRAGAPRAVIGIAIALLVLLPEATAAVRAAAANRLQTSMNLALGSALATIGLTVPVVVAVCLALGLPLELGLAPKDIALLALTLVVGTIGLGTGRTNVMFGAVQLVIFAAFLFLSVVP